MTPSRRAGFRIAHLTLAHKPFDVRIFEKECRTLVAAGYNVHLAVPAASAGSHDGVTLHPIDSIDGGNGLSRWQRRLANTLRVAQEIRADLYHVHDPELVPVALALKRGGARVIYDAHEDAPVEAWSMNRRQPLRRVTLPALWWSLLKIAKLRLDAFVAATPRIARTFPADRTIEVRNYPRLELFPDAPGDSAGARRPNLIFAGLLSESRGAIEMLDAMAALDPKHEARLKLFGRIHRDDLAARMRSHPGWPSVDHAGEQPWREVLNSYRTALAGFLLYEKTPEQLWCMPVKMFEFLLSGLPVIAADIPFWREILDQNPSVIFVDMSDVPSVTAAIRRLLEDPNGAACLGRAGMLHARERFDWTKEGERLVRLYDHLLN